ncbi:rod-binding protein [Shewanella sp. A25]|nr:rod-binding protein [Shewanella shenzhenensis]
MTQELSNAMTRNLAIDPKQAETIFANLSDSDGLQLASQQFEAIFLQLVLKNMNSATEAISGDNGMFGSSQQRMYQDMYNAQMSQHMAASGQVGLAEQMVQQLGGALQQAENKLKESAETAALPIEGSAFAQPLLCCGPDFSGED